jgi:hypothetical protein
LDFGLKDLLIVVGLASLTPPIQLPAPPQVEASAVHTYSTADGRPRIALAARRGVSVYDGDEYSLLFTIPGGDPLTALTAYRTPAGEARVVVGCEGGSTTESVKVYDGETGELLRSMCGHGPPPVDYGCCDADDGDNVDDGVDDMYVFPDEGRVLNHVASATVEGVTYLLSVSDCRTYKVWAPESGAALSEVEVGYGNVNTHEWTGRSR